MTSTGLLTAKKMFKKLLIISLFCSGITAGCKKESTTSTNAGVPNVAVNINIDVTSAMYPNLVSATEWMYVTGGYDGVIIYCQSTPTPTSGSYVAFDRGCPYDCATNSKALLNVQSSGFIAICPVCGSKFSIVSGNVLNGPATLNLKQYYTSFSYPDLTVSN
jgi:nitrite reductase/ring-hydroxylating ferredoxin subunit